VARVTTSQTFGPASVEVASLYYISFIFTQKWDHASAFVLVNTKADRFADDKDIEKVYEAYQNWFANIKKLGLVEARKQKLDPLASTGIRWY
jgi:hypothetical protein